ncbi:hypothetical protein BASA61_002997 [Batrachochytrium salamandrivorans]|nr:hypothetical protein BASA61_002997 [Batrachochytrium salamandrivorans]
MLASSVITLLAIGSTSVSASNYAKYNLLKDDRDAGRLVFPPTTLPQKEITAARTQIGPKHEQITWTQWDKMEGLTIQFGITHATDRYIEDKPAVRPNIQLRALDPAAKYACSMTSLKYTRHTNSMRMPLRAVRIRVMHFALLMRMTSHTRVVSDDICALLVAGMGADSYAINNAPRMILSTSKLKTETELSNAVRLQHSYGLALVLQEEWNPHTRLKSETACKQFDN